MRIVITRPDGDLKREIWTFSLRVEYSTPCICFEEFSFQTRLSTRHKKWTNQTHWQRIDPKKNTISCPNIPADVEAELRIRYQAMIAELPITR